MTQALRLLLILVVVITLAGLLFSLAQRIRPDHTDEICRVRLLRLGEAVALYVEDHNGAAFPGLRNPAPFTLWIPGLPQAADEVLRPYLGGATQPSAQRPGETREAWMARVRAVDLSVCPATGFGYLANLDLLTTSPGAFSTAKEIAVVFHCQGRDPIRGAHRHNGVWGIHQARLGVAERVIARGDVDIAQRELHELVKLAGETPTIDQNRRIDALRQRIAALERAFSDGRATTTISRLINDVTWAPYP